MSPMFNWAGDDDSDEPGRQKARQQQTVCYRLDIERKIGFSLTAPAASLEPVEEEDEEVEGDEGAWAQVDVAVTTSLEPEADGTITVRVQLRTRAAGAAEFSDATDVAYMAGGDEATRVDV